MRNILRRVRTKWRSQTEKRGHDDKLLREAEGIVKATVALYLFEIDALRKGGEK